MHETLGEALSGFDAALRRFHDTLTAAPELEAAVFADAGEWIGLLRYKLVPHFAGEGCLVAAVAGGTNTGKSTVFNLLLGADISPVRNTAAATRRPVLAANQRRYQECLEGKLVPEFRPRALDDPESAIDEAIPTDVLFTVQQDSLPDRLVLLDTPDVDSIERVNWQVAEDIRAAGDVLVAVLTGEKYKDDRVVEFFRRAHAAGRIVIPLMNKADPDNDFEVARLQLADFVQELGLEAPVLFAIPHDFKLTRVFTTRDIQALDHDQTLRAHLEALDVPAIKERVYKSTVQHFAREAGAFLDHAEAVAAELRQIREEFEGRARNFAQQYDPAPGAAVGGLFHEFVQSKRGPIDQAIGTASRSVARGVSAVGRTLSSALFRRATLEKPKKSPTSTEIRKLHVSMIEEITNDLAASYFESAGNLRPPADRLVLQKLDALDLDAVVEAVVRQTLKAESVSDEFRAHAQRQLETWWSEHRVKRRAIEALDRVLMITPAAIAGVIAVHTGGVGVPEALIVAAPVAEQFAARVVEYQFGDAMFDFISPWRREQREALEAALKQHLVAPALEALSTVLGPFEDETMQDLRKYQEQCLNLS